MCCNVSSRYVHILKEINSRRHRKMHQGPLQNPHVGSAHCGALCPAQSWLSELRQNLLWSVLHGAHA